MPLELWAQAAMLGLSIVEVPVPLIYLDLARSFGGAMDDGGVRLKHYNQIIDESILAMRARGFELPDLYPAGCGIECCS
jgi:dolichol-phosphate mannosyltransferase